MARIAIVGAGIMGAAAAWRLSHGEHEVVVYEQFDIGHTRGSSHGRSRIVRLAYPETSWVQLAAEAMRGWRELEEESGQTLLELYGLLEIVDDPALSSGDALEEAGAAYELLPAADAKARWPIGVPDGWSVVYQPEAGIVRADLAWRAFLDVAVRNGVELRERSPVRALADVDADVVVVTAGPWSAGLLAAEGIDLRVKVTRETVAYFRREGEPLPSVVQLDSVTRNHALYSLCDPIHGLKAGTHHAGAEVAADEAGDDLPDLELVDRVSAWVGETYRGVDPTPVGAETCVYTTTADESFVPERNGRAIAAPPPATTRVD